MKRPRIKLNFLTGDLVATRFLISAAACLAFGLITARPLRAQNPGTVFLMTGTAGFETGLQRLAYIQPPYGNSSTNSAVTVLWGDGSSSEGLIQSQQSDNGNFTVMGTHLYAQPSPPGQPYTVQIQYQWQSCTLLFFCQTNNANLTTTATIQPPGNFVILSIGDSVASGEGNPNVPNLPYPNSNKGGVNIPPWSYWDDLYSSYDINPFPFPDDEHAEWPQQAFPCHRSGYAGTAQAAGQLAAINPGSGITFIHYACSGAVIEQGDTEALWVQDVVGQLKVARARLAQFGAGIDILLISAGSNSLYGPTTFLNGFGGLAHYCLSNGGCSSNIPLQNEVNSSFRALPTYYKNLAMEINCQQPPTFSPRPGVSLTDPDPGCTDPKKQIPKLVLITEYMDPTHDENGNFPSVPPFSCGPAFLNMAQGDFEYFYNGVVVPLNNEVDSFPAYAQEAGLRVPTYAVPNIALDFQNQGVCAGNQRWVNNGNDSMTLLAEGPHPGAYPGEHDCSVVNWLAGLNCGTEQLNGMLHPNSGVLASTLGLACSPFCGHEDYAFNIVQSVQQYNPPVTTASATAGDKAYSFGTWTNESVNVSLSARNAIQQAQPYGLGTAYYAVDNSACGSTFAQPGGNVPGCSTYLAPFTVSSSGKHTVTFFGSNVYGFPIAGPIPMPPQNPPLPCPNPNTNPCNVQLPPLVPPLEGILQSVQVLIDRNPPLNSTPPFMTIPQGESASYTITLGHVGWTGQTIKLSCTTDAELSECTMLPASVTLDATSSNTSVATVVTTLGHGVLTPAPGTRPNPSGPSQMLRLLLALVSVAFLLAAARALRARRWAPVTHFAAVALLFGLLCAGCNGTAQVPGTPRGLHTITITGTDGTTTNTIQVNLLVE